MTAIWNAAAGTPTATHRIPVDTSAAGTPTMYTVQQLADLETSVGKSVNALGAIAVNTAIDLALGGFVSATIGANLTLSFTNPPAGGTEFTLVLTNGGAFTITWPGTVSWAGATAPTLTASGTDVLRFTSGNGGTNWYGWVERDEVTSPGGSTTQLQYNDAGSFGGMAGTAWDNTNRALTVTGATLTASAPILDLSQTWNNAAVTFTGVKVNVTNTASAAPSLLQDWQVDGASKAQITKAGALALSNTWTAVTLYGIGYTQGWSLSAGNWYWKNSGGTTLFSLNDTYGPAVIGTNAYFGFSATAGGASDILLVRDAAAALALRNTTNAQTFRVYDTYTDASNYARIALNTNLTGDWVQVAAETAGTGADNYSIALSPTGAGAISAHVPDSGTGGGNARGTKAVDWQMSRFAATNVASGTLSVVSGGEGNTSSGIRSAVGGGSSNTASGERSVIAGGYQNTASGYGSWVSGGQTATTRGVASAGAYAMSQRAAIGDRQTMVLPIACAARTDATATVMTSDAGAASATNQMVLPNNSSMFFEVDVVAHDSSLKSASWKVQGTIRRGANAAATAIVGTNVTTTFGSDLSGGSPGVTCTADTTNGALAVTFTGIAATTIYPSGHIRTVIAA